jgi:hypothetical protein
MLQVLRNQFAEGERFKFPSFAGGDEKPEPLFRAFSFSDLTVRATLIDPEENFLNILNREIQILAGRQLELACWGADEWEIFPVLLRGAISVGSISINPALPSDELLFGPALVKSYKLESETAVFPRIVIDREVMRKAAEHGGRLYYQFIKRGDDGIDFIHYLFGCNEFSDSFPPVLNSPTSLANHKIMIEKKIAQLKKSGPKSERIIQKYLWLAAYHNLSCHQLASHEPSPVFYETQEETEYVRPNPTEFLTPDELFHF